MQSNTRMPVDRTVTWKAGELNSERCAVAVRPKHATNQYEVDAKWICNQITTRTHTMMLASAIWASSGNAGSGTGTARS